jgi:hypothetical protein
MYWSTTIFLLLEYFWLTVTNTAIIFASGAHLGQEFVNIT